MSDFNKALDSLLNHVTDHVGYPSNDQRAGIMAQALTALAINNVASAVKEVAQSLSSIAQNLNSPLNQVINQRTAEALNKNQETLDRLRGKNTEET